MSIHEGSRPVVKAPTPDAHPGSYFASRGPMPEATRRTVPAGEWVQDMTTRTDGPQMPRFIADLKAAQE